MKLMPASSARWMMRIESSWSVLPHAPNIIAPRHSGLTLTPVLPSLRCSIAIFLPPMSGSRRSRERLANYRVLGRCDLVQAAHGRAVWGAAGDLGVLCRLLEYRGDRFCERVERLLGLGLRRLDHQRLVHQQREVHGRRVKAEVEQALGEVERLDLQIALHRPAGEDGLVHAQLTVG